MDILGDDSNHQDELEKAPDKDDGDLLDITNPQPEDKKGNEGRGGHITDEAHYRFCQCFCDLEGSHDQSDGNAYHGSDNEPHHHPVHTVEDIGREPQIEEEINTRPEDPSWRWKK